MEALEKKTSEIIDLKMQLHQTQGQLAKAKRAGQDSGEIEGRVRANDQEMTALALNAENSAQ